MKIDPSGLKSGLLTKVNTDLSSKNILNLVLLVSFSAKI